MTMPGQNYAAQMVMPQMAMPQTASLLSAAQRFCLSTSVEAEDTGDVVVAPTVVFDLVTAETFTGLADFVSKYASTSTFCTRTDL